jgi:hypothetical protein
MSTQGWLPIETAPRDGTLVDLWMKGPDNPGERQADCWYENGNWWQEFGREGPAHPASRLGDEPTHWRHLPEPPAEEPTNG